MSEAYQAPLHQQNPQLNAQFGNAVNPFGNAQGWNNGLGLAAFGQNYGGQGGWQQNAGWGGNPWQQRQLSQQDVGEVVRQLLPILPQVVAQAQQGQAAFGNQGYGNQGFGGFGGQQNQGYGHRQLSPQDVNEVVRQILPVIPQIVNLLQQGQQNNPYGNAIFGNQGQGGQGNLGGNQGWGNQNAFGNQGGWNAQGNQNPFGLNNQGQHQNQGNQGWGLGQQGYGAFGQAAFGNQGYGIGGLGNQRQLNQQDVGEIVRQLTAALPQVIANLQQTLNQQQRSAI